MARKLKKEPPVPKGCFDIDKECAWYIESSRIPRETIKKMTIDMVRFPERKLISRRK
jgi:hypothetical protein